MLETKWSRKEMDKADVSLILRGKLPALHSKHFLRPNLKDVSRFALIKTRFKFDFIAKINSLLQIK